MRHSVWILLFALSACGQLGQPWGLFSDRGAEAAAPSESESAALPETDAGEPISDGDIESDDAAALSSVAVGPGGLLGPTVVSLGDASRGGIWVQTPLVAQVARGEAAYQGQRIAVTLEPIEGAVTAGSRMSLAAMQALGVPLTALTEVDLYLN